jgi:hypothetical protein
MTDGLDSGEGDGAGLLGKDAPGTEVGALTHAGVPDDDGWGVLTGNGSRVGSAEPWQPVRTTEASKRVSRSCLKQDLHCQGACSR